MYSEIFIKDLAIYFNDIFFALVNYIYSEQKNPDWIFKTSFISIFHNLRELSQPPSFVLDNQEYYLDYINEVSLIKMKLPHVVVQQLFLPQYNKI